MATTHRPARARRTGRERRAALAASACIALAAATPALAQAPEPPADAAPEPPDTAPEPPADEAPEALGAQPLVQEPPRDPDEPETIMVEPEKPKPEPPEAEPGPDLGRLVDLRPHTCDPYVVHHPARRAGFGLEIATGYQDDAHPVEHLSLGLGLTAERMVRDWLALGARLGYVTAGDESRDDDGDGRDDRDTGNAHLLSLTAGARLRRWYGLDHADPSVWQLGLAAGYVQALSDVGAGGPVAEVELGHTWFSVVGLGLRVVQGFGAAEPYRAVLASAWLGAASKPAQSWGAGCDSVERPRGGDGPAYGLGVHVPLAGHGVTRSGDLGVMPPGLGLSLALQVRYPVDLLVRGDFVWFLRGARDRLAMHTGLAGVRLAPARGSALGFTALAGYAVAYRPAPANIDSGPVLDLGVSWDFARAREAGLYLGAHGRFGLSSGNRDLGAVFLSLGLEARSRAYAW